MVNDPNAVTTNAPFRGRDPRCAIHIINLEFRQNSITPSLVEYTGAMTNTGTRELIFHEPKEFPLTVGVLVFESQATGAQGEPEQFARVAEDRPVLRAARLAPGDSCDFSGVMSFGRPRPERSRWLISLVAERLAWVPNATGEFEVFDVRMEGCDSIKVLPVDMRALAARRAEQEAPRISAAIDATYYSAQVPKLTIGEQAHHYATAGMFFVADPTPGFRTYDYIALNPGLMIENINPFLHCLSETQRRGGSLPVDWSKIEVALVVREPLPTAEERPLEVPSSTEISEPTEITLVGCELDCDYYRETYQDIAANNINPVEHYCLFGWREGRDPAPWFSTRRYLAAHEDVKRAGINPLLHYIVRGREEGRRVWPVRSSGPTRLLANPRARLITDRSLRSLTDASYNGAPKRPTGERHSTRDGGRQGLDIHWVIPDFAVGSGGHMTIFRMIRFLELRGHRCHLWLTDLHLSKSVEEAYDNIIRAFPTIGAPLRMVDDGLVDACGDAIVATGWNTVPICATVGEFSERFYFVQDYEPNFFPAGSYALAAEATYAYYKLNCICAGPWLAGLMRDRYQLWARYFWLAYDADVYHPPVDPTSDRTETKQLAIYARNATPRRAVELVLLALEILAAKGVKFEAHFFGAELEFVEAPFVATSHGILSPTQLAELYRACDLGICFSATNYSLVPQEMMACGLPVLELDGDSTRQIFPEGVVLLSAPHPAEIAGAINTALSSPDLLSKTAARALTWVSQFSWEQAGMDVERAITDKLGLPAPTASVRRRGDGDSTVKASVCIPTLNGGDLLLKVVGRILEQTVPWDFELLIMDSSSDDGSIERLPKHPSLRVERIERRSFQHGRTRNALAERARGEYLAFLTQDALPVDRTWLYNFVTVLAHFPDGAGAFGRHYAWPEASPFTKRDLKNAFESFGEDPLRLARDTKVERYESGDIGWRQRLHFFSDNNALLRRGVWKKIPYPEVDFGEDQVWADRIIAAGYAKIYVPSAGVFHSHDYTPNETRKRMQVEADFFRAEFGYVLYDPNTSFEAQVARMNASDRAWGRKNDVAQREIDARCQENEARLLGYRASYEAHRISAAA